MLITTLYGAGLLDTGTPAVQLQVVPDGRLIALELCEHYREATQFVWRSSDQDEVSFLVGNVAARHTPEDVLAAEQLDPSAPEYPMAATPVTARVTG